MVTARLTVAVSLAAFVLGTGSATAATPAPGWTIDSLAMPTNFSAANNAQCEKVVKQDQQPTDACDAYQVTVTNTGSQPSDGSTVTIADTLPAGLTVQRIEFFWSGVGRAELGLEANSNLIPFFEGFGIKVCSTVPLQCSLPSFPVAPDDTLRMVVYVTVDDPNASGPLTDSATVSGGGAPEASTSEQNAISSTPPAFGLSSFNFYIDGLDGARDTQAGDHPYELVTTLDLNNEFRKTPEGAPGYGGISVHDLKNVVVDLPLGFVGSTLAAPECTLTQLSEASSNGSLEGSSCPPDTKVGHIITEPIATDSVNSPIYNLVPEYGYPAEFGYVDILKAAHVFYARVVPTPGGYVLQTTNPDIPQISLRRISVTFFGSPAVRDGTGNAQIPFFTDPTDCSGGPVVATIYMDSWQHPGHFNADGTPDFTDPNWASTESASPPVTGCNALQFTPELGAQPTTTVADSPSGLDFELKLPQTEDASVPATPALKTATVMLPEGMTVDPSAGQGLEACSEAQIGWLGGTPKNFSPAAPQCPEASKIGSLELTTPLIPGKLTGAMYIARQNENPYGSVLAAYVVVDDPVTGVLIKLAGRFMPNPTTGRITAVFEENPQLPFSDLKLHFFGGPRAELTTPENCGLSTTTSDLAPWSAPDSGPDGTPFDSFPIETGCVNGFAPAFTAGSTNLQAGSYTPFVASFSRSDTDQDLAGLSVSLPPGLLANIANVPLCPDANANAGTCPESTQVGTVRAGAGPGPNPLFVGGKAYLTGPYNGGPYGLSVVVPAIAGPFNFGLVVVRQSLRIDPNDAHVTDVSDPFPTILNPTGSDGQRIGIPIRLRRIDVSIDRPGFTFNPTNCAKLQVGGSMTSTQGQSSALAVPFQVTNCTTLGFKPVFKVSTQGKTSRANGASLSVKLTYPKAAFGSQTNIKSVKVDLPKQLPSRLTTLQKACPDSTFNANPAACPAASRIGSATATTPILSAVLSGPAYFVSHGGAKFPELIVVLSGQGITVELHGETFISKQGITSSTFRQVPDVPIGAFTLTLPEGPNSALAANGNLCASTLTMPTAFTAQNGATIKQSTPISVTGCKPAIRVLSHSANANTATIAVSVPAAGKLVASGAGLSRASKSTSKAGTVTLALTLSGQERLLLKRHPGRKLAVAVKLLFTPTHGHTLSGGVTVLIG